VGTLRKYLLNVSVVGAVIGVWGPIQATKKGPRDWRLALAWASWAIGLLVAITSVRDRSQEVAQKQFNRTLEK
jgi:hypothetical protein